MVVENREPYYFIIIYKCKDVPLSLFSYQMLASTFDFDERSSYYKAYDPSSHHPIGNSMDRTFLYLFGATNLIFCSYGGAVRFHSAFFIDRALIAAGKKRVAESSDSGSDSDRSPAKKVNVGSFIFQFCQDFVLMISFSPF